jgi:arylsulfatase A-like enzyme
MESLHMCAHEDFLPTFAAAAGETDVVKKCLTGYEANGRTFKVHLDGYNLMPFFRGSVHETENKAH